MVTALTMATVLAFGPGCRDPGTTPGDSGGTTTTVTTPPTFDFPEFSGPRPKNVLMLSVDTLRRDVVSRYDAEGRNLTPFLDSLLDQSVVLQNHSSCSNWTYGSVVCALTGLDNLDMGFIPYLSKSGRAKLPQEVSTLAEWMRDAGYYTILKSTNGWFGPQWDTDQGYIVSENPGGLSAVDLTNNGLTALRVAQTAGQASKWLLHLHFIEPHAAYNPPSEYLEGLDALPPIEWDLSIKDEQYDLLGQWYGLSESEQEVLLQHLKLRYEGEVRYLDDGFAAMWNMLDTEGLLDDTLVVFWVDHGEQFFEHGQQTHAYGLHTEESDVLAFFWAKNMKPAVWEGATDHIDIAPTTMELIGLEAPAGVKGKLVGSAPPDRSVYGFSAAREGPVHSVRVEGKKLHYHWRGGKKEFFDRTTDPRELTDLYDATNADVIALWDRLLPKVNQATDLIDTEEPYLPGP